MAEMILRTMGSLIVLVHSKNQPTEAEWNALLDVQRSMPDARTLVVTDGGGPSNKQRMQINQIIKETGKRPRVAVVSSSAFVRGIVSALNWFNPEIKTFPPDALTEAIKYLEAPEARASVLLKLVEQMRVELNAA